jgi:type I restriction enzyme S subunit
MSTASKKTKIEEELETGIDSEQPEGWIGTTLREGLSINYGKGLKESTRKPGPVPVYGSNGVVGTHSEALTHGPTIVIGRKGTVGAVHLSPVPCWPIDTTYYIDYRPEVDTSYLSEWLRTLNLVELDTSTAVPGLNRDDLYDQELLLAPRSEQERIAKRIDELRNIITSTRERLNKCLVLLRHFRQGILAAACSGKLTEDWRKQHPDPEPASKLLGRLRQSHETQGFGHGGKAATPTEDVHTLTKDGIPEEWEIEELQWLCEPGRSITYGILKPGPDRADGVPYIRVADFPRGQVEIRGIRKTTRNIADEYKRSTLRAGDVLLSIRGTAGRICRVPSALDGANITQDTARIAVHPQISADYVEIYLRCQSVQRRLEAAMKGVAVRGVNIGDVRVLQVAVPPVDEQNEIVRRVDALFKLSDAIERRVRAATLRAERLTQAILAKAFRGELVPTEAELARREVRSYEPASVLLERIKMEREKNAAAATGNRKPGLRRKKAAVVVSLA